MTVGRGGIGASVGWLPMLAYLCGTPVLARRYLDTWNDQKKNARLPRPSLDTANFANEFDDGAPPPRRVFDRAAAETNAPIFPTLHLAISNRSKSMDPRIREFPERNRTGTKDSRGIPRDETRVERGRRRQSRRKTSGRRINEISRKENTKSFRAASTRAATPRARNSRDEIRRTCRN